MRVMVKAPEDFWGSNYYANPPLTDEAIVIAEQQLGVRLPGGFIDLLRQQNGGYTKGFAFPTNRRTSWAEDHVPLDEMGGIVTDPAHKGVHNILLTEYMSREWGLPPRQILLAGDGHWWITLDYRESDEPVVSWIDVEVGQDLVIAPSFAAFLDGLVPKSSFTDDA